MGRNIQVEIGQEGEMVTISLLEYEQLLGDSKALGDILAIEEERQRVDSDRIFNLIDENRH